MKKVKKSKKGREYVRSLVRKRDKYTCADCGTMRTLESVAKHNKAKSGLLGRIKNLDVHHINGMCGKKSRGYDKIIEMEMLITLCHKCHYNRPEHGMKSEEHANYVHFNNIREHRTSAGNRKWRKLSMEDWVWRKRNLTKE